MRLCPLCQAEHDRSQAYCAACHAAYMRSYRRDHPLTAKQRRRDAARSYAHVYLTRGKLWRKPCEACGAEAAEMHHPDYSQPLNVIWLCRSCHVKQSPAVSQ